jgi:hypothetical protein
MIKIGETKQINDRVSVTRVEPAMTRHGLEFREQYGVRVDDEIRGWITVPRGDDQPWQLHSLRLDGGVGPVVESIGHDSRHGIQRVKDPIADLAKHAVEIIDHPHRHELETTQEREARINAAKELDRIDRLPGEDRRKERIQVINRLKGILHNPNLTDEQKGALQGAITALEKALEDLNP